MTLHISHNDLDGIACGILVKSCLPSVKTIYTNYDELDILLANIPSKFSDVIITDLGPSESSFEMLSGEKEFLLIDHHKSTQKYAKYPFVHHSIEKSATLLTYEYFTSKGYDLKKYENFAECVNDFDLWKLKRSDSLHMNMLLSLLGIDRFEKRFFETPYNEFSKEEKIIIELEEERRNTYIEKAAKSARTFTDTQNRTFSVVFAEQYSSELGNYIITNGSAEYVLILNLQRKKASLRSAKYVDISDIAISHGGGGHKNAAGFNIKFDFDLIRYLQELGLIK